MMDEMFPRMRTMMSSEPQAATERQDLMGMSLRTFHFDGVVRVLGYLAWLMQCDMRETCTFHRLVLKLLRWHCPPTLWHLKTPVHMFSLDASSRPTRTRSFCGVTAIRRRYGRRCAA